MLFVQKHPSSMFGKVVNMLLNWLPKLRMFHSKSVWISDVVDNHATRKSQKESQTNFKTVEQKILLKN